MHPHGNPKGTERQFAAGQLCKFVEDNFGIGARNFDGAGARSACNTANCDKAPASSLNMPGNDGLRGSNYRFALVCSAELCATWASFAEISAVAAAVPQLGASLPSPQARGR
jgi:hypothetical protein